MNEQKHPLINARSGIAKHWGGLVTYHGTGTTRNPDVELRSITRPQLRAPIRDLLTKAVERGYGKEHRGLIRATFNPRLAALEDEHIVTHFSSVIRGIVNYYSFVNKRSSLRKVVSIYKKPRVSTPARKHGLRSAEAASHKFGPNPRITKRGKEVASPYHPDPIKTIVKYDRKSRFSHVTYL